MCLHILAHALAQRRLDRRGALAFFEAAGNFMKILAQIAPGTGSAHGLRQRLRALTLHTAG